MMLDRDDISNYVPSVLNPRSTKKYDFLRTQSSIVSRWSLSLKRNNGDYDVQTQRNNKAKCLLNDKENHHINLIPEPQNNNVSVTRKDRLLCIEDIQTLDCSPFSFPDITRTNEKNDSSDNLILESQINKVTVTRKGRLLEHTGIKDNQTIEDNQTIDSSPFSVIDITRTTKENVCSDNLKPESQINKVTVTRSDSLLDYTGIKDNQTFDCNPFSFFDTHTSKENGCSDYLIIPKSQNNTLSGKDSLLNAFETSNPLRFSQSEVNENPQPVKTTYPKDILENEILECISLSSATLDEHSESTIIYTNKPTINLSFGVNNCESVDVTATNSAIKRFTLANNHKSTEIHCDVLESSQISTDTERDENMNEISSSSPLKRSAVSVNIEIKKQKQTRTDRTENSKVLILKTNAIEKISHVIVQPPNYKFVKRNLHRHLKSKNIDNEKPYLKQISIDSFIRKNNAARDGCDKDVVEMSRHLGVADAVKSERVVRSAKPFRRECASPIKLRRENASPMSVRLASKADTRSPRGEVKSSNSESQSPRVASSQSCRKSMEPIHFGQTRTIKTPLSPRNIPHHKIVAGTHFAVDAFSYGDIPNVKHYFLTHFHSDHYSGLKKSFNKLLFCSKITSNLCMSRIGVNAKCIHVINTDETLRIDGVEVTAVDANHCPGALMFVFTLPNGKTLLHTGDFRACPPMESYPIFWNKDIHTVYLDTTYCNPRYDFPTQDQSLEMALYILRQKKMVLEKAGKKFTSVLIVCGTYTIGKEKFFMGMSRRVGCSVWACPEKERVLHIVEGKVVGRETPHACQLHVVPMRDLTHEKLRSYLDSMQGAFSEVVAFKPSGWENGKNSVVEKDSVTIHGIPYSEHSSFSELVRFVKYLSPKQVVPTVDISGGVKAVQKYFPCPLVYKDEILSQSKLSDYFSIQNRHQSAIT